MNIYNINSENSIGNSVSSININYSNLEYKTLLVKLSAEKYWYPMFNYYQAFSKFLKEATTISQNYSASFINTSTIIEKNSSAWIKPITIFYPSIIPNILQINTSLDILLDWIKLYFPEKSIEENIPNYVENQTLIVYAHTWAYGSAISENTFLSDYTLCQTSDKEVCAHCVDRFSGYVGCNNGGLNCNGRSTSCQKCNTLRCSYSAPPYNSYVPPTTWVYKDIVHYGTRPVTIQVPTWVSLGRKRGQALRYVPQVVQKPIRWITKTLVPTVPRPTNKSSYGSITANVEMTFQDRNELDNIKAAVFKIKNCEWIFDKLI